MAQSHTPCNRCVRFATTVASGHATLATKRTLLLTWTGLPPAGSYQLCLAHSLDHLVGADKQAWRHGQAERLGRLKIDGQLKIGRLLDRKVGRLVASEYLDRQSCALKPDLFETRFVAKEAAGFGRFGPVVNRGQPRGGGALDVDPVDGKEQC